MSSLWSVIIRLEYRKLYMSGTCAMCIWIRHPQSTHVYVVSILGWSVFGQPWGVSQCLTTHRYQQTLADPPVIHSKRQTHTQHTGGTLTYRSSLFLLLSLIGVISSNTYLGDSRIHCTDQRWNSLTNWPPELLLLLTSQWPVVWPRWQAIGHVSVCCRRWYHR